jgi:hypothetical protein
MWYFTMKKAGESRPALMVHEEQSAADAAKIALMSEFPGGEFGNVFEESKEYQFTFPHVTGEITRSDGAIDLHWSDGERTAKPV